MKHACGTIKKIHAIRFEPGEDVMLTLQKFCQDNGIGNGVVISGVGSLQGCTYLDPVELPDKPGLYGYSDPIELPCPIELISVSGIICTESDGRVSLHLHGGFADEKGNQYGGHLKEGNRVLTTVEMVIGEIEGVAMTRGIDPERGVPVFAPIQL